MNKIVMAAYAALALVAVSTPSDARQRHQTLPAAHPGQQIDIAALPAYPTEQTNVGPRQPFPMGRKHIAPPSSPSVVGSGIVRSAKTGATTRVASAHRAAFQAYIDDLEGRGAVIYYMGGYRKGRCSLASQHPCGGALDVCQDSRDHVSGRKNCHLPPRAELIRIASAHGLFEGGQWCNGDMGHAQVIPTPSTCSRNLYAAVSEFHARSKRHKIRYAQHQ